MNKKHRLLFRQLKKMGLDISSPPNQEQWISLLEKVSSSYFDYEQEIYLLERSLKISSKEMQERWETMQSQRTMAIQSSKMATLGEMASGIAHEINSPLTTIYLLTQLTQTNLQKPDYDYSKLTEVLKKIEETSARIAKIVSGLRAFSRDGDGDPMSLVSISAIIEDTLEISQEKLRAAHIKIELDIDRTIKLNCRAVQLSQVLLNLISNSYDATIGTKDPWIKISAFKSQSEVKIIFIDSGQGIPAEIADRILEPFFTTKGVGKGTGLGLSISKGLVEANQGRFELDQTNPNTCFVMTFQSLENTNLK